MRACLDIDKLTAKGKNWGSAIGAPLPRKDRPAEMDCIGAWADGAEQHVHGYEEHHR
jgi:hypothetical protein